MIYFYPVVYEHAVAQKISLPDLKKVRKYTARENNDTFMGKSGNP